jgi:hypothetical protein
MAPASCGTLEQDRPPPEQAPACEVRRGEEGGEKGARPHQGWPADRRASAGRPQEGGREPHTHRPLGCAGQAVAYASSWPCWTPGCAGPDAPRRPLQLIERRQEVEKENRASNSDGREHNRRLQADGSKRAASEKGKKGQLLLDRWPWTPRLGICYRCHLIRWIACDLRERESKGKKEQILLPISSSSEVCFVCGFACADVPIEIFSPPTERGEQR